SVADSLRQPACPGPVPFPAVAPLDLTVVGLPPQVLPSLPAARSAQVLAFPLASPPLAFPFGVAPRAGYPNQFCQRSSCQTRAAFPQPSQVLYPLLFPVQPLAGDRV